MAKQHSVVRISIYPTTNKRTHWVSHSKHPREIPHKHQRGLTVVGPTRKRIRHWIWWLRTRNFQGRILPQFSVRRHNNYGFPPRNRHNSSHQFRSIQMARHHHQRIGASHIARFPFLHSRIYFSRWPYVSDLLWSLCPRYKTLRQIWTGHSHTLIFPESIHPKPSFSLARHNTNKTCQIF